MKRRTFLTSLAITLGGAVLGCLESLSGTARSFFFTAAARADSQNAPDSYTGKVRDETIATLIDVTHVLLQAPIEESHYQEFFRFRAENVPGYHELYVEFGAFLNRRAKLRRLPDFSNCERTVQASILNEISEEALAQSSLSPVQKKYLTRFQKRIILEILRVFSQTDAWLLLGYESWPGSPAGLDRYTKPLPIKAPRAGKTGR
ncbi:MAG: hypothetical protein JRJ87_02355 [Deltaproteobacteria bacterium]|nr:hypothetical protein [Deltaproteobacteria bacterium]